MSKLHIVVTENDAIIHGEFFYSLRIPRQQWLFSPYAQHVVRCLEIDAKPLGFDRFLKLAGSLIIDVAPTKIVYVGDPRQLQPMKGTPSWQDMVQALIGR